MFSLSLLLSLLLSPSLSLAYNDCLSPVPSPSLSLSPFAFRPSLHSDVFQWAMDEGRGIVNGSKIGHSYSHEMNLIGSLESALYGLRHLNLVTFSGEKKRRIAAEEAEIFLLFRCFLAGEMDYHKLRESADLIFARLPSLSSQIESDDEPSEDYSEYKSELELRIQLAADSLSPSLSPSPSHSYTLNNGLEMPMIGFGTWRLDGDGCVTAIEEALRNGYKRLDTAYVYQTVTLDRKIVRTNNIFGLISDSGRMHRTGLVRLARSGVTLDRYKVKRRKLR